MPERSPRAGDAPLSNGNLAVVDLMPDELVARSIEAFPLGDLEVPTGWIVAADPLSDFDQPPFVREVQPGRYPVTLYRADFRVALAAIRFADGPVQVSELAKLPGRGIAVSADPDELHGHDVDSARSCFMDASAAAALRRANAAGADDEQGSYFEDLLGAVDHMFRPLSDDPVNVAIFESGDGDGTYQSYWGLDGAGRSLTLVTDFQIIKNADGRSRSHFSDPQSE